MRAPLKTALASWAPSINKLLLLLLLLLLLYIADKTCLLQCTVYVTLRWKRIRYINLKLTKLRDARARIYRESVRLMCLTC